MEIPYLTPCSHCGNTKVRLTDFFMGENKMWQVYCEECRLASPTALSEKNAVAAWNRLSEIIRNSKALSKLVVPGGGPLSISILIGSIA